MTAEINIGYSKLSDKIYIWKSKKQWNTSLWVGEKKDYTNSFLSTVDQYFPKWELRIIKHWEEEELYIHIWNNSEDIEKLIWHLEDELSDMKQELSTCCGATEIWETKLCSDCKEYWF